MLGGPLSLLFSVVVEVRRDLDAATFLALFLGCFAMLVLLNKHPQRSWVSTVGIVALWGVLRFGAVLGFMAVAVTGLIDLAAPVDARKLALLADGWRALALGAGACVTYDTLRRIGREPRPAAS